MAGVKILIVLAVIIIFIQIIIFLEKYLKEKFDQSVNGIVILSISTGLWGIFILELTADQDKALGLNNWGDFLAGFFAPVLFAWIVYGISIQKKEFHNAVKEYKKTVRILEKQSEHTDIQHKNTWYDRNVYILVKYIDRVELNSISDSTSLLDFSLHINSSTIESFKSIVVDIYSIIELHKYIIIALKERIDNKDMYNHALENLESEYYLLYGKQIKASEIILLKIYLRIYLGTVLIEDIVPEDLSDEEVNERLRELKTQFKNFYKHKALIDDNKKAFLDSHRGEILLDDNLIDVMAEKLISSDLVPRLLYGEIE